mmetsp:Transcript_1845/g.1059  ORF Transcript_1845/g.1059 Transcript_1845/m.1059 type:complete len:89 (-) Transcript_1845:6-272(-)
MKLSRQVWIRLCQIICPKKLGGIIRMKLPSGVKNRICLHPLEQLVLALFRGKEELQDGRFSLLDISPCQYVEMVFTRGEDGFKIVVGG